MKFKLFTFCIGFVLSSSFSTVSWAGKADSDNRSGAKAVASTQMGDQSGRSYSSYASAGTKYNNEYQPMLFGGGSSQNRGGEHQKEDEKHNGKPPSKTINYYVRGLMQDLVGNLQYVNASTPVAVASFLLLDSDYSEASLLGNQISESLMHEIHKFGIPVIDYKTTDKIRVTEQGDLAFSRDYKVLSNDLPIRYIVVGTLVKHQGGYLVNARIVGAKSKAVVASAQSFIPAEVSGAIMASKQGSTRQRKSEVKMRSRKTKGVSLIQG